MDEDGQRLLTRRGLLATGALVAAGVALPAAGASARTTAAAARARELRSGYRRARFAPHVGTAVELRPSGGGAIRATLASIEDVPHVKGLAGDEDAYTLRLRAPAVAAPPAEGIARISHDGFGVVDLYVAPVASAPGAQDYLATINRRVPRWARGGAARRPRA